MGMGIPPPPTGLVSLKVLFIEPPVKIVFIVQAMDVIIFILSGVLYDLSTVPAQVVEKYSNIWYNCGYTGDKKWMLARYSKQS
jgi:hypothetical protein